MQRYSLISFLHALYTHTVVLWTSLFLTRTYHDCAGKYLSYVEWSRKTSARVMLQSASAKKPRTWRLANKGNKGVVTLEAVRSLLHVALYAVGRVQ